MFANAREKGSPETVAVDQLSELPADAGGLEFCTCSYVHTDLSAKKCCGARLMFLFGFGFPVWGEVLCGVAIGSDRTMRLEVLRVLAESQSIYNLFGRAAAILIDATLRGPESSLRELLAPLVLRLPCVRALPKTKTDEWVMLPHTSPLPPAARCASTLAGRVEAGSGIFYVPATQADSQLVDTIAKAVRAGNFNLRPAFHSYAEELDDKCRMFDPGWIRNATEILRRTGWTPEHATACRTLRMLNASSVFFHLDCDDVRKLERKISAHIAAGFRVGASDGSVKHDTEVGTAANLLYCSTFKYSRPHLRGYRRRGAVAAYGMEHLGLDRLLLDLAEDSAPVPAVPLLLVLDCQSLTAFLDRLVGTEIAGADKDVALVRNLGRVALKYTQVDVMFSPSHLGVSVNEIADAVTTHLHTVTTPAETTVPPLMSHEEAKAAVGDIMEKSELDAICDLVEKKSQSSQKIAQDLKLTRKKVHDLYRLAKGEGRWFRRTFANLIGAIRFKEPTCAGLQKRPRLSCGAPEDK